MLIGPNSTGKSTVLKAIALAMATPSVRRRLEPDARNCWNRQADKRRHDRGFVRLTFNEGDPVELRFSWRSKEYEFVGTPPHLPLLAYGSTRVPPRRHGKAPMPSRVRLNNLFNTRASLSNVHAWLADPQRVKATDFKSLVKSFRDLLPMGNDAEIRRRAGQVYSSLFADVTPLDDLSDGYRSAVALASDIMMNLSTTVFSMEHVEGTVLLDEIGVHLHPSWKIEIVSNLRTLFPKVRFVSTTHEPLCLRELEDGEIFPRSPHRVPTPLM